MHLQVDLFIYLTSIRLMSENLKKEIYVSPTIEELPFDSPINVLACLSVEGEVEDWAEGEDL